jgi:hypothetical protein
VNRLDTEDHLGHLILREQILELRVFKGVALPEGRVHEAHHQEQAEQRGGEPQR